MILKFLLYVDNSELEDVFKRCAEDRVVAGEWPEDMEVIFDTDKPANPKDFDFPDDSYSVLITDDEDIIVEATAKSTKFSKIISMIKPDNAIKNGLITYDQITDVWPAEVPFHTMKLRMHNLLYGIGFEYSSWRFKNLLNTTIDSVPSLVWFKDPKGAHLIVNDSFSKTVHKTKEDIQGRGHYYIWDITPEEYAAGEFVCMESETETMNAGTTCIFDEQLKTSEGMKKLKTYKTPTYDPFGKISGTVGIAHDITNFANMDLELSIFIESLPFPLIFADTEFKIKKSNEAFRRLLGNIEACDDFDYITWKKEVTTTEYSTGARDIHHTEIKLMINGDIRYFDLTEHPVTDAFGASSGYFIIFREVTYERKYQRDILKAANTDGLTGLYNRRYFYDYINQNSFREMTLLYMDLDNFKSINDNYGHAKGDQVIIDTANYILETFPAGIAARLGGDEFATILNGIVNDDVLNEKIKELETKISSMLQGLSHTLTISVGVAVTDGTSDVDAFMHEGDSKMYAIKKKHHKEMNLK